MPCALPARVSAETASGVYMAGLRNSPRQCSTALSSSTEAASDPAARFSRRAAFTAGASPSGGENGTAGSRASNASSLVRTDCNVLRCASASIGISLQIR